MIDLVEDAGLRARGGAGIPCGPKWRTVRAYGIGATVAPSMVVNAAEGEPGSFKDRAILAGTPTWCSRVRSSRPAPSVPTT